MGINWNFLRGGANQTKKPSVGGVWILSGTTHYNLLPILATTKVNYYVNGLYLSNLAGCFLISN